MLTYFAIVKCFLLFVAFLFFAVTGDKILENPHVQESLYVRAFVDNATHFFLGVLSWLILTCFAHVTLWKSVCESFLCGVLSSIIDVDHFLAAYSFKLQDAINLQHRPFLHNTTLVVMLSISCILISDILEKELWKVYSWMFLVAGIAHHLRDSLRRGLWLWPFGSTRPTNFYIYLAISFIFPLICYVFMTRTNPYQEIQVVNLNVV